MANHATPPPVEAPTHAKSHVVPESVFDACAALRALATQRRAIDNEREAIAEEFANSAREIWDSGDLGGLAAAIGGFKIVYGRGWSKRLKESGLPDLAAVQRAIVGQHNDGPGRWRGTFPIAPTDNRPPRGKWVVYKLLDGDELLYIGSTGDLSTRLKAHARDKDFDGWRAAECKNERACRDLETALIDRYRPPLNRMIPKPRCELVGV